jgi:hypothetical protein
VYISTAYVRTQSFAGEKTFLVAGVKNIILHRPQENVFFGTFGILNILKYDFWRCVHLHL